jgi:hypothetical protein
MPWIKGQARPKDAGRKKGTPNKKTEALEEICARHGLNPFEGMVKLALEADDINIRFNSLKEICQYLYPKRKALEVSSSNEGFKIVLEDFASKQ